MSGPGDEVTLPGVGSDAPSAPPGPVGSGRHGAAGTTLGPYELRGELGRGGMGVVFRAYRPDLKREFALKVIIAGRDAAPDAVKRFIREAQAAASLAGHPGIVGVHDIGEADGKAYFAMDLVEGQSLEALIDKGDLEPRRAAEIVAEAARAVQYAHERGVLHRDLKPANILVTRDGRARVTDFGLAKVQATGPEASRLTKSGQVLGTPSYMPPEQAEGEPLDVRADVYSLGATLYEALTGEPPFTGETLYNVLAKVLKAEPVPPRQRDPRVPQDLDVITLKCLEKRPEARYQDANALADDLARWRAGQAITARPPGGWERVRRQVRRHPATIAAAFALLLGAGGIGGAAGTRWWTERTARRTLEAQHSTARPHLDAGHEALSRLERLFARDGTKRETILGVAREATAAFMVAREAHPSGPDAPIGLAKVALALRDSTAAQRWCDLAVSLAPSDAAARLLRGIDRLEAYARARTAEARGDVAIETSQMTALRAAAEADLALAELGLSGRDELEYASALREFAAGRWTSAAVRLEKYAATRLVEWGPWKWSAFAWAQAGEGPAAIRAASEAVRNRPTDGVLRANRGWLKNEFGDYSGAREDYDAAIALGVGGASVYVSRGFARERLGELQGAIADFDTALKVDPECHHAYLNRGLTRADLGDLAGALADCDRAIATAPRSAGALSNRGALRERRGDLESAMTDYDAALVLDPTFAQALANRSDLKLKIGDIGGALRDAEAAASRAPKAAFPLVVRGNVKRDSGDPLAAIVDFDAALALDPRSSTAYHGRALSRGALGDEAGAVRDFDAALVLNPRSWKAYHCRGNAKLKLGDNAGALADYDRALAIEPISSETHRARGRAREALHDLDGAMADYDTPLAQDTNSKAAYLDRACLKSALGRHADASADYDLALALDSKYKQALHGRGVARARLGDIPGAIADFDAALAVDAAFKQGYADRGSARRRAGDWPGAMADFDAALAVDPRYAPALNSRGAARHAQRDLAGALADLDLAIEIDPAHAEALANRGIVKLDLGDLAGALMDVSAALAADPRSKTAHYTRGLAKQLMGDLAGAVEDYDAALALDPRHAEAHVNRGMLKAAAGDLHAAMDDYAAALEINPRLKQAHYNRGEANIALGRDATAVADYDAALALDPRYTLAYVSRSAARLRAGDLGGAVADADAALALDARLPAAFVNRALARRGQNDIAGAIADLRRAIDVAAVDWPHREKVQRLLAEVGVGAEARR